MRIIIHLMLFHHVFIHSALPIFYNTITVLWNVEHNTVVSVDPVCIMNVVWGISLCKHIHEYVAFKFKKKVVQESVYWSFFHAELMIKWHIYSKCIYPVIIISDHIARRSNINFILIVLRILYSDSWKLTDVSCPCLFPVRSKAKIWAPFYRTPALIHTWFSTKPYWITRMNVIIAVVDQRR